MKDLILDETTSFDNNYSRNIIKYISIGVFVWLAIATFAYTFKLLTKHGLLMTTVEPVIIYGATTAVQALAAIIATLFAKRKISGSSLGDSQTVKALFIKAIIISIILTLIQFLIGFYLPDIYLQSDMYMDNVEKYWDFFIGVNPYIKIIIDFLPYMIVGTIFWRTK